MANEALAFPVYQPATRIISAITNTYPALVTTGLITYPGGVITVTPFDHLYVSGMLLRIIVPSFFGMTQIDGLTGEISVVNTTQFTIDIDATNFDPFVIPPVVLVPMPIRSDPLYMVSLPPIQKVSDGNYALMELAQCVPYAEDNSMLTAAVRNVLPYV